MEIREKLKNKYYLKWKPKHNIYNKSDVDITNEFLIKMYNEYIIKLNKFIKELEKIKKDGTQNYDYNKILDIINNKEPNYYDDKTKRNVYYYDRISIIREINTKEVVAIRKSRLNKKWKEL